mmetsp:Transcript_37712/g.97291  ORF Transcript_37712/g.97291 Transcript_37712/m.97291 type:complete len:419 (-) Transcript_37712:636-1892(-)
METRAIDEAAPPSSTSSSLSSSLSSPSSSLLSSCTSDGSTGSTAVKAGKEEGKNEKEGAVGGTAAAGVFELSSCLSLCSSSTLALSTTPCTPLSFFFLLFFFFFFFFFSSASSPPSPPPPPPPISSSSSMAVYFISFFISLSATSWPRCSSMHENSSTQPFIAVRSSAFTLSRQASPPLACRTFASLSSFATPCSAMLRIASNVEHASVWVKRVRSSAEKSRCSAFRSFLFVSLLSATAKKSSMVVDERQRSQPDDNSSLVIAVWLAYSSSILSAIAAKAATGFPHFSSSAFITLRMESSPPITASSAFALSDSKSRWYDATSSMPSTNLAAAASSFSARAEPLYSFFFPALSFHLAFTASMRAGYSSKSSSMLAFAFAQPEVSSWRACTKAEEREAMAVSWPFTSSSSALSLAAVSS